MRIPKKKKSRRAIKTSKADGTFSDYIRLRDGMCVRCKKPGVERADGLPVKGLQCSHYFGRRKESVRFDPENCDALCGACHPYWETTNHEAYRNFKISQLGQDRFELLVLKANSPGKKNRELSYRIALNMLKELKNKLGMGG